MKPTWKALRGALESFDAEDDPSQPHYDPAHLGGALILTLVAVGALYWILWAVLVYEGGLFAKIVPTAKVLLRRETAAQLGYKGPWDRGPWEGWLGNLGGLAAAAYVVATLHRLYHKASARSGR